MRQLAHQGGPIIHRDNLRYPAHDNKGSSADLLAGLSIAGLLLPAAVAYSVVAQLPPQAGMIGVFVGLVWYGLIGRSRFAIVSATRRDRAPLRSMAGAEPLVWPHGTRGARRRAHRADSARLKYARVHTARTAPPAAAHRS